MELISTQPRSSTACRKSLAAVRCLVAAASSVGAGLAAEGDHVKLAVTCSGDLLGLGELGHAAVVVAELAVDRRAADQLQGLREVRVALALAFAGQLAGRPAERLEERVLHLAVRDLRGSRAPGRPSNEVVVLVTVEIASSRTSAGKSLVWACEKYRLSSTFNELVAALKLIRAAVQDRADQLLQVVAVLDKIGRQAVEQRVVARGLESRKSSTGSTIPRPIR